MHTAEAPPRPELVDPVTADVVVVGAGIAGLSVAAELAETGRSVVVLEADRIASGVTGHTTAKLSAHHGAVYHRIEQGLGEDAARSYATWQSQALERVESTARALDLDCELEYAPAFAFGQSPDEEDLLRREAEAAARAGLPASFVSETELPFPVVGAVRVEGQLTFHPRKYLLGLARHLEERGVQIFEHTRVTGLSEGEPCTVTTAGGATVAARDVVVATHFPIFDRSLLFGRLTPKREFAVAAPVPVDAAPEGMYINVASEKRSLRSAPYDGGHRLLIATGSPFTPGAASTPEHAATLHTWLRESFPVGEPVFQWAAQDNHTGDQVPFIGRLHPRARRAWVATGFNGWGMSSGVVAGLLLRRLIGGERPIDARIFDPGRVHPTKEVGTVLTSGLRTAMGLVGSRVRARLTRVSSVDELAPGTAGLVNDGSGQWATYVDEDGVAHQVSPTCTHLGCRVEFNAEEREWDCPCHGSRFGLDGSLLQGPATRPLRRRDDETQE
jgi:glycine/D-amino acid oxidase-like deaminating enzyme/nitrite reductase/ring-hydroxylating ferredoxin subunit